MNFRGRSRFNINEFILYKMETDPELSFKSLSTYVETVATEQGFCAELKTMENIKNVACVADSVRVVLIITKDDEEHELDETWTKEELLASPQPMITMLLDEMRKLVAPGGIEPANIKIRNLESVPSEEPEG